MVSVIQIFEMRKQDIDRIYADSIRSLLNVAMENDNRAQIAASVLLSAYNSFEYKICVNDLVCLGIESFDDAMKVIMLQPHTDIEPHQLLGNGLKIFRLLQKKHGVYAKYHHNMPVNQEPRIVSSQIECLEEEADLFAL